MKIFVPYTRILKVTEMSLMPYDYEPVFMESDDSYWQYFQQRWLECKSFINCEHDTVFYPGAIESLEDCPHQWCAFEADQDHTINGEKYPDIQRHFGEGGCNPTLSLMKFDAKFIKAHPYIWTELQHGYRIGTELPSWQHIDSWLAKYTYAHDVYCHQHYPNVVNANQTKTIVLVN
jgi:hypothetical protein